MGYIQIHEPIEVTAQFSPQGIIQPLNFTWAGRRYQVKETTYRWRTGKGRAALRFFAVIAVIAQTPGSPSTNAEEVYQLCYQDEDSTWRLESLWTEG